MLLINSPQTHSNTISGNYIGLAADGDSAIGNGDDGIRMTGGTHSNIIGGDRTAGYGNVVSGNTGAQGDGIELNNSGAGNAILGNYIGTDHTGMFAIGNNRMGVTVWNGTPGLRVGDIGTGEGNVISGNGQQGIYVGAPTANTTAGVTIAANIIGLGSDGDKLLGNANAGVQVAFGSANITIGGPTVDHRNVISGNAYNGIVVTGGVNGTVIRNNHIGTDVTGLIDRGNADHGIRIDGASNVTIDANLVSGNTGHGIAIFNANGLLATGNSVGTDRDGDAALANEAGGVLINHVANANITIGGDSAAERNIISGNTGNGLEIYGGGTNITARGNFIGAKASGLEILANSASNVVIDSVDNVTIGGGATGQGNVIVGAAGSGIYLSNVTGGLIAGNSIGLGSDGTTVLGNANGIELGIASSSILIGGTTGAAGNRIVGNSGGGIRLASDAGSGNTFRRNVMYSNGLIGIDLGNDGVSANDNNDVDGGPNERVNTLRLFTATAGTSDVITGDYQGLANETFTIELYRNSYRTGTGFSEGATYLDTVTATTDGLGRFAFSHTLASALSTGHYVTALVTDSSGNTSEFSNTVKTVDQSTILVTTTADTLDAISTANVAALSAGAGADGKISLREAITAINSQADGATANRIEFDLLSNDEGHFYYADDGIVDSVSLANVTNTGTWNDGDLTDADADFSRSWWTISVTGGGLPAITDAGVTIDGTTQRGYIDSPIISLDGSATHAGSRGIEFAGTTGAADGSVIALNIHSFQGDGIVTDADRTTVSESYIGTDTSGRLSRGNIDDGIQSSGGHTTLTDNLISGSGDDGVNLMGDWATLTGNRIGTSADGLSSIANGDEGIDVAGANATIGTAASGNLISGNDSYGILLQSTAGGATVMGNIIGLGIDGQTRLGNGEDGILTRANSIIGGLGIGERNIVSDNGADGIAVRAGASHSRVIGNYIGTDRDGGQNRGNTASGIFVDDVTGVWIDDNVISGNAEEGIYARFDNNNQIRRNKIGTDATGLIAMGNGSTGISLNDSLQNTIDGNIISDNGLYGISIGGSSSTLNVVTANLIGVDATGAEALGNVDDGVRITSGAHHNTIGGDRTAGQGNTISGSTGTLADGIEVISGSDDNFIYGNAIGTNASGTGSIGNKRFGINIFRDVANTQIGGIGTGQGNIISGNTSYGVNIGSDVAGLTERTAVVANTIGLGADGTTVLPNGGGVRILAGAFETTVGGVTQSHRNLISGNTGNGVYISDAMSTTIVNNFIGLDRTGELIRGNQGSGVLAVGVDGLLIDRNVLSGNQKGVLIQSSTNVTLIGNLIGTDKDGLTDLGNTNVGVHLTGATSGSIMIGGDTASERNIISGNDNGGILSADMSALTIRGNYIGVDATGGQSLANSNHGVSIYRGSGALIGGAAAGQGNVVSGSTNEGIYLNQTSDVTIAGNTIGLSADRLVTLPNNNGIYLTNGATGTLIGGAATAAANWIGGNHLTGITLHSTAGGNNTIRGNRIVGNGTLGIDLGNDGRTLNDVGDVDAGVNDLQNFPELTTAVIQSGGVRVTGSLSTEPSKSYLIELFAAAIDGDADRRVGSANVMTDGSGNATIDVLITESVASNERITATATLDHGDGTFGGTSELADWIEVDATPDDLKVTTSGGGIRLNTDSGNDAYLIAEDGGAILGGLSALTLETRITTTAMTGVNPLLSYATPGDSNEVLLYYQGSELVFAINGTEVRNSDVNYALQIADGREHAVAVTWDAAAGDWAFYIDGVQTASGTGLSTGTTVAGGGTLVFGQEQDSVDGDYQPGQYLEATLHGTRIFSDVRTAAELAASYASDLPNDEPNLIVDWRMDSLSTGGVVVDEVSGNHLVVAHVSDAGFSESTPELVMRIKESDRTGTVVANLVGIDADRRDAIDALLAGDPSLQYSELTNKFYKFESTIRSWTDAVTFAGTQTLDGVAGSLVEIRSAAEQEIVAGYAANHNAIVWLGGSDAEVEGEFRWADGTLFWRGDTDGFAPADAYQNFAGTEPNDFSIGEDFVSMRVDGLWNDQGTTDHRSVIQWDADAVLDAAEWLTYSIQTQTVAGAFAIEADSGQLTVGDGSLLDSLAISTHTVTVRVTDGGGHYYDRSLTIAVDNVNEANNAPTNLSSGIELNLDGGNDAFLQTSSGGSVFGGLQQFSAEISHLTSDIGHAQTLISYEAPSGGGNELLLRYKPDGNLEIQIHGGSNSVDLGMNVSEVDDGVRHSLAVTWDNTHGNWSLYLDGDLRSSGTGLATGHTLLGGGMLVLGQDQDGVGINYDPDESFAGTLYDIRVWNDVRTEAEISLNHRHKFGGGSVPGGLIANWQMDGFNGSGEVVDVVGGNNLSVGHATGAGFVASTPVDDLHASEHAFNGATVGFVIPADPDSPRDIVADGNFLESGYQSSSVTYHADGSGAGSTLGGWTVTEGSVDALSQDWTSLDGDPIVIELNGNTRGAIRQELDVEAGHRYQVIFSVSGPFDTAPEPVRLRVSADGQSQDFTMAKPDNFAWGSEGTFNDYSMTFVADDPEATLEFKSLATGSRGPFLTNVRVVEIPAAVTSILNGDPTLSYDAGTNKFYRAVDSFITWDASQNLARSSSLNGNAGQLVTIDSAYENELVRNMARAMGTNVWLGGSDATSEGTWRWQRGGVDAETFWSGNQTGAPTYGEYTNFTVGEPNAIAASEDYLQMYQSTGKWNDGEVGFQAAYVIEWDAAEVLSNFTFNLIDDAGGRFAIDAATGQVTVADASLLDYENSVSHEITVEVADSLGEIRSDTFTVAIENGIEVVQTVPGPQTIDEDTVLTFSTAGGNAVVVSDTLTTDDTLMRVTLSIADGVLNLSQTTGLLIVHGVDGSSSLVIEGTESALNAAFEGMTFTPDADFHGSAALNVITTFVDLEGQYTFEGGSADDQSGGAGVAGTFEDGAGTISDPVRGEVLSLDGTGAHVEIAGTFGDPANVTLSAWVNLTAADGGGAEVISLGDSVSLRLQDAGSNFISGSYYNGTTWIVTQFDVGSSLAGTGWHHVAYSFNDAGDVATLHLDGVQVASASVTGSISYTLGANSTIGKHGNGVTAQDFNGRIDDARVYTRALSSDEIAAIAGDESVSSGSVAITVEAVNDPPTLVNLDGNPTFIEGGSAVVLDGDVTFFDTDIDRGEDDFDGIDLMLNRNGGASADDIFTATGNLVFAGNNDLDLSGTTVGTVVTNSAGTLNLRFNATATQAQVDEVLQSIAYSNSSEAPPASVQIDWSIEDNNGGAQGSGGNQFATGATTVDITAVNDAPVLDNTGTMTLTSITEDQTNNGGNTVASIIASASGDRITDVDSGASEGIAITAKVNGNGTWQYSIDGGSSWNNVGTVSATSSLLLRSNDLIRFVPNAQNATTGNITFRAWDQSDATLGQQGSKVDTSTNGGTTAFSTATESATISVTAVNDAPTIANGYAHTLATTNEDTTSSGTLASAILTGAGRADVDSGATSGLAITSKTGNGTWQYSTNGTTWRAFGNVSSTSALLISSTTQVRYIPDAANGETATFEYKAWDRTTGSASSNTTARYATVASSGGTSAFSSNTSSAQMVIGDVNDAPVLDDSGTMTLTSIDEDQTGDVGQTVASIIASAGGDRITDVDSGPSEGIAVTARTNGNGQWQYSIDGGTNWLQVGTVSNSSALLLRSTDLLRFDPDGENGTTQDITFRAWDQSGSTAGQQGDKVDTTTNGGTTPFSSATESASITVDAINDDPINAGSLPSDVTVTEDVSSNVDLSAIDVSDVDAGGGSMTVKLTTATGGNLTAANGTGITIGGSGSGALTLTGTQADLNTYLDSAINVTYLHSTTHRNGDDADTIQVEVTDNGNTGSGGGGDIDFGTINVDITAVNDEEVLATNDALSVAEGSTGNVIATADLHTTDVDNTDSQLVYTIDSVTTNGTLRLSGTALGLNDTFTQADIDAGNVTYDHDGSQTNSDSFDFTVDDGSGTDTSATFNFTVTNVNDAPINTVPGAQSVDEDTLLAIAGISVADSDDNLATVRLSVVNGTLDVTLGGAATISAGADQSNDLTLSGSLVDINNTLASLTYQGNLNFNGSDTLTVLSTDSDAATDSDTVAITVGAVNDTPDVSGPGSAYAVDEQTNLNIHGTGFSVSDIDAASGTMTATFVVGEGTLSLTAGDSGVTIGANDASSVSFTGTLTQINALLGGSGTGTIVYNNGSDTPSASTTIILTVNDSGNTGTDPGATADGSSEEDSVSQTINVTATNDDPTNAGILPADVTVTEDVLSNVDLSSVDFSDVDAASSDLTVTLSTSAGGELTLSSDMNLTFGGSATARTITGTLADLNAYFDTPSHIRYLHGTANINGENADTITVVMNDNGNTGTGGGTDQNLGTVNVDITAVNDAPVNTVPGIQTVDEDTTTAISGLSIADVDVGSSDLSTRLQVTAGIVNVTLSGSATISVGTNGTGDLTIQGSVADINATLASLTYRGNSNVNGTAADTLTVTTNDLGNTGSGGVQSDVDTVQINIDAVNDTPNVTGPGAVYTVDEQSNLSIQGTGFSVTDVDAASGTMTATFVVGEGTLSLSAGDSGVLITANNAGTVSFTGTLNQINALLIGSDTGTIAYNNGSDTPSASTTITIIVNDGGNSGSDPGLTADGGSEEDSASQTIYITATNDDPTNAGSLPSDVTVTEDVLSNLDLSAVNFGDVDAATSDLTVTLSTSTGGELTLAADAGMTFGGSATTRTITGTLTELNNYFDTVSNIQYQHGSPHTNGDIADTINIVINDGGNTGTGGGTDQNLGAVNVDITAVNDEEVLATNETFTVAEGSTGNAIATANLQTTDVDNADSELVYTIDAVTGNGTLRLSGSALALNDTFTQADIDAGNITYDHNGSQTTADSFDFTVDDGFGTTTSDTFNFSVINVNDAPVISVIEVAALNYTENDAAVVISSTILLQDADGGNLASATVEITAGFQAGDLLEFTDQNGISGSLSGGVLTLTGSATVAEYQTALRSVTYRHSGDDPNGTSRTVEFTVNDGDSDSNSQTRDVVVEPINDAPSDAGSLPGDVTVTEDVLSNVDLSTIQLSDPDDRGGDLTVTLSTSTGGELMLAANANLTFGGSATTRTLTGTVAELNAYFDIASNIRYQHGIEHTFGDNADTITVVANDNGNTGTGVQADQILGAVDVDITGVNDSPGFVDLDGTPTYIENGSHVVMDNDVTVVDPELLAANSFGGSTLTFHRVGGSNSEDRFSPSGNVTAPSPRVLVNGVEIGTYTHGGGQLRVIFNASATASDVNAVAQTTRYGNVSNDPPGSVDIQWTFNDGNSGSQGSGGALSTTGVVQVTIEAINDNPTNVGSLPGEVTVSEDSLSNIDLSTIQLSDPDDRGGDLTVTLSTSTGGELTLAANANLTFGGSGTTRTMTGTVAELNAYLDVASNIQYQHGIEHTFGDDADTITVVVNDHGNTGTGGGTDQTLGVVSVDIVSVNDEQVLETNDTLTITEGSTGNVIATADLLTTDVDHADSELIYTIDVATSNGTLRLSGVALGLNDTFTQDDIDNDRVTYDHDGSQTAADSFDFTVDDGDGSTTSSTFNFAITNINDAPIVSGIEVADLDYTENDAAMVISSTIELTDDDGGNLTSATIEIAVGFQTGDWLGFTNTANITGSFSGGTLSLSGSATVAEYQSALRSVTYQHNGDDPNSTRRTVGFTVNDGDTDSNTQTRDIAVEAVNDDPTDAGILPSDVTVTEDVWSDVDLSSIDLSDLDDRGGDLTVTLTTSTGGELTLAADAALTFGGTTTSRTITGTLAELNTYFDTASNIQYLHGAANINGGDVDTITVVINDNGNTGTGGGTDQNLGTINVDITAVNDEEVLATNKTLTVAEGSNGNVIATPDLHTTDVDNTDAQLVYTVDVVTANGTLRLSGTALGVNDTFTQDDVDSNRVTYDHNGSQTSSDWFDFTVDDGSGSETSATFSFVVSNVNDPPVNTVPGAQSVNEDTPLSISGISVADDDDNLSTVRLTVNNGTLDVTLSGGATISAGADQSNDLTLSGSLADINNTLASLVYQGDQHFNGNDTLTILSTDSDTATDSDTIAITVAAVNDTPEVSGPGSAYTVNEQNNLTIHGTGFSVTDVDAASGTMTATIAVAEGAITVAEGDSGIAISSGNASGSVILTGTLTQINNLLTAVGTGTIIYHNASDTPSASTNITVTVNDGGSTGSDPGTTADGSSEEDSASQTINITAINDDPTNAGSLPSDITVTEDVLSDVDLSVVDFSDVDAASSALTVKLSTSTGGELTLAADAALTFGGTATTRTITGTLTELNTYFASASNIQYLHPSAHFNGDNADTITVVINDNGNTGTGGGTDQSLGIVNVDITAVNDEQVLTINTGLTVVEGSVGNVITAADLHTADVDNPESELVYTIDSVTSVGTLWLSGTVLSVNDTFTQADVEAGNLTYSHDGSQTSLDSFNFTVDDGQGSRTSDTFSFAVTNVNDLPVVSGIETADLNYTENDAATVISATLSLADDDGGNLSSATVRVIAGLQVGDLLDFVDQNGITGSLSGNTLTLSGSATVEEYQSALRSVTYRHTGDDPNATARTVSFTVNDGDTDSNTQSRAIAVQAINDDPTNAGSLPTDVSVTEDVQSDIDLSLIDLSDLDDRGGDLTVSIATSVGGELTLAADANLIFGGFPTAVTLTGTKADLNAYFDIASNIQYLHPTEHSNGVNADTITVFVKDNGNTGMGGRTDQNLGAINVDIIAVNDQELLADNNTLTVAEGSSGNVIATASLHTTDVDNPDSELVYIVDSAVGHGVLRLSGVVLDIGDTFTQLDIDNHRVSYDHDGSETSADSFDFTVDDGSGTSTSSTFRFSVTNVNDAPLVSGMEAVELTYTENDGAVAITSTMTLSDVDDTDLESAVVQISGGYRSGEDTLSFSDQNGIMGSFDSTTATWTLSGTATLFEYETAIRSITYSNHSENPDTTTRTISVTVNDGAANSHTVTRDIAIERINDTPDVVGPGLAYEVDEQTNLNIHGTGFGVTDLDASSGTVTAAIAVGEGAVTVAAGDSGVVIGSGNGTGNVTLTGTLLQINDLLSGNGTGTIVYRNSSDTPSASTTITVTVNDGGNTGFDPGLTGSGSHEEDSASQTIHLTATNDDPTNVGSLPSNITVNEDVSGDVDLSAIDLNDVDAGGGPLTLKLTTSTGGHLTALSGTGITIVGSDSGSLWLSGSQSNLNAYLNTASNIQYLHQTANVNGDNADTITININDHGNTGSGGGTDQNLGTVTIDITAVNDAPVATDDTYTASEDVGLSVDAASGVLANDSDVDVEAIRAVLVTGPANASSFTLHADGSFQYTGAANYHGIDTFTYRADDGDAVSEIRTVTIDVASVNDLPPTIISGGGGDSVSITLDENLGAVTTIEAIDADLPADTLRFRLEGIDADRFTIDEFNGSLSFLTAPNFEAPGDVGGDNIYDLTVVVSDGIHEDFQNVEVRVADVDEFDVDIPIDIDSGSNRIAENSPVGTSVGVQVFADDADGTDSEVTYVLIDDASGRFDIDPVTGQIVTAAVLNYEVDGPSHRLTVLATSADGSTATRDWNVDLVDVNESPVASEESFTTRISQPLLIGSETILSNDSDVDGDALSVVIVAAPRHGTVTIDIDGNVIYAPGPGHFGIDTFVYVAFDGKLSSGETIVTVRTESQSGGAGNSTGGTEASEDVSVNESSGEMDQEAEAQGSDQSDDGPVAGPVDANSVAQETDAGRRETSAARGLDTEVGIGESMAAPAGSSGSTTVRGDDLSRSLSIDAVGLRLTDSYYDDESTSAAGRMLSLQDGSSALWVTAESIEETSVNADTFSVGAYGTSIGLASIGYVLWALRGGMFAATFYAGIPQWRSLDPATLLGGYQDAISKNDKIEQMLG